ncbi:hypothetical protein D3C87_1615260 [compost metagenome]
MYQFEYLTASDTESLETGIDNLYSQNDKPVILEIFTPTLENDVILKQYFKELV